MFKNGWTSVTDRERSGRPSASTSDDEQEQTRAMILDDGITLQHDIGEGSAHAIVHDIPGYHKVCARWVPKSLTEQLKRNRFNISSGLSERYHNEGEHF
jgi:hypothetical protein